MTYYYDEFFRVWEVFSSLNSLEKGEKVTETMNDIPY